MPRAIARLALFVFFGLLAPPLTGQAPGAADLITGIVTANDGHPVGGAEVEVLDLESRITRTRRTDAGGRFTIVCPDGGGRYQVTVRAIGWVARRVIVTRAAGEDRVFADVQLAPSRRARSTAGAVLAPVTIRVAPAEGRGDPGATGRDLPARRLTAYPVDDAALAALAALAPGVVGFGATDTSAAAFSVAGQRTDQNRVTLDGLGYGGAEVPPEAVRTTRIITSAYDVSRGGFTGGEVAATSRGGSNDVQGSARAAWTSPGLRSADPAGTLGGAATEARASAGFGGPVIPNRLFAFGAAFARWRDDDVPSPATADPRVAAALGVPADSLRRFAGLLDSSGIAAGAAGRRRAGTVVLFGRGDARLGETQTLTLRGDAHLAGADHVFLAPGAVPAHGGRLTSSGGGGLAALTSQLGGALNEGRIYVATGRRAADPTIDAPEGRVTIASAAPGGESSIASLAFGGNAGLPRRSTDASVEAGDELSWLVGSGAHRLKAGALLQSDRAATEVRADARGSFAFASLGDLADGRPAWFSRAPAGGSAAAVRTTTAAAYIGDVWRPGRDAGPQLTLGVRAERSVARGAPTGNGLVDSLFGLRTDRWPSDARLSPRFGFTWAIGGAGDASPAALTVRGGVGEFRGRASPAAFENARTSAGLSSGRNALFCAGPAAPRPAWTGYAADPSTIPGACVAGAPATLTDSAPDVVAIAPDFAAPRAWRASLGVERHLGERFTLSLDGALARGALLDGARDVNLAAPIASLRAEGGRPLYAPVAAFDPGTGAVALSASRRDASLGRVLEVASRLGSDTRQLDLALDGVDAHGVALHVAWTWMRSRDQASAGVGCCGASGWSVPGGEANALPWTTSDLERRHQVLALVAIPLLRLGALVTVIARAESGAPFTPMVSGDVNGDGTPGDAAFLFDPARTADTAVAAGVRRLLARAPGPARRCLTSQLGRVAARNGCRGPWTAAVDAQLDVRAPGAMLGGRLTLSLIARNLPGALDRALHGAASRRGWGDAAPPDPLLLVVRGWNPATGEFRYAVNPRFGAPVAGVAASPFALVLQGRVMLGVDPALVSAREMIAASQSTLAARLASRYGNPVDSILARSVSLALTAAQVERLGAIGDSLDDRNARVAEAMQHDLFARAPSRDAGGIASRLLPLVRRLEDNIAAALSDARAVLTPGQWLALPESLRAWPAPAHSLPPSGPPG